jgi:ATP-dependent helicase/nuclease subunit B
MRLVFGFGADGRTYPDTVGTTGDLDDGIVGPQGLVSLIESQLGLGGPAVSRPARVACWLTKLRAAGADRFWRQSFEKDAWSTAETLLDWRDALVAGGWSGQRVGTPRVDDLADAEQVGTPLPLGLSDRIALATRSLSERPGLRIGAIVLVEPRSLLPPGVAQLVDTLEAVGVEIGATADSAPAAEASDLRRVQDAIAGAPRASLTGDGSLVVIESDTALMAAETVADWLAAGPADAVIVAADGDTALLDRALKARGLPALGLSGGSPWRGAFQVLPLAFATAWRPFNPRALLDLMMLPRPPIARWAARRLARTLAEQPGVGGAAWLQTWAEIEERLLALNADHEDPQGKTEVMLAEWRCWTEVGVYDRSVGMPIDAIREVAGRVSAWAIRIDAGAQDSLLLGVASAAGALVDAATRLDLQEVPALLLERMIGQVIADGVSNPAHVAESGTLRAVRTPGALWARAPRVIWWGFSGPGEKVGAERWARAERDALSAAGVVLETAADAAARIGTSYARVVKNAGEQLLLVRPALAGSEQTTAHPLAHQLRPILRNAAASVFFRAERLLGESTIELARRIINRTPVETLEPPQSVPQWALAADFSASIDRRVESATSLERLLNCQMSWFAQDVLGLRRGRHAELPEASQLFGNLAHEIARRLLPAGAPPPLAGVRAAAATLFDELLPAMAAPLFQPEHAGELAAARDQVPAAMEALVRLLHEQGLEVVGAELQRDGAFGDLPLTGRIDLLVRRGTEVAVLDLKWTRSDRRYAGLIADGKAVQLAIYHALARADGAVAPGGYFLLRQRRVVAGTGSFLTSDPIEVVRTDHDTLRMVAQDWAAWKEHADRGSLVAAGLPASIAARPDGLGFEAPDEPCRYCDLTGLCRVNVEAL